jgi:hypothetical protein
MAAFGFFGAESTGIVTLIRRFGFCSGTPASGALLRHLTSGAYRSRWPFPAGSILPPVDPAMVSIRASCAKWLLSEGRVKE